ncbi:MAG: HEAT repeat domain-containing protein, partial [Candidatus Parvarchaeum sp.]|nr:HEAT repeat domain-containing protein [Candidatus Parvarchaeum tengchongense]
MPRFHSLEQPPPRKARELARELHEYPELKPRLAFSFPLNEKRAEALQMIAGKKEINEERVIKLLRSSDFIEQRVGLFLLKNVHSFSERNYQEILSFLETMKGDEDWFVRETLVQALGNLGEKA